MCSPQAMVLWAGTGRNFKVGEGELRNDTTVMEGRCGAAVHGCNVAHELVELVRVVRSAPRRKHVVGQVIVVAPHAVWFGLFVHPFSHKCNKHWTRQLHITIYIQDGAKVGIQYSIDGSSHIVTFS